MADMTKTIYVTTFLTVAIAAIAISVRMSIPLLVEIDNIWISLGYGAIIFGCLLLYCVAAGIVWDTVMGIESEPDDEDDDEL